MTREQYSKHKECFNWFMEQPEGTEVWCRPETTKNDASTYWDKTPEPCWEKNFIYVINDEYVEFRKNIVDGEAIQVMLNGSWKDRSKSSIFSSPSSDYRIKPKESKFKVGMFYYDMFGKVYKIVDNFDLEYCKQHNCELWDPKQGEWCWFWDDNYTYPVLRQYEGLDSDTGKSMYRSNLGYYYDYCEPFIGTLPTVCQ